MSMFGVGSVLGLASGAFSAFGASAQAESTNKAGQQSYAELLDNLFWGMLQQKKAELGSEGARKWYEQNVPRDVKDRLFGTSDYEVETVPVHDPNARPGGVRAGQGSPFLRQVDLVKNTQKPGQEPVNKRVIKGIKGKYDSDAFFSDDTPGYLSQMEGLRDQYGRMGLDAINQSRAIEEQARSYGAGQRAQIERDSGRFLKEANRASLAALNSAGLGGTSLGASQVAGNAANVYRAKQDQLGLLDDRTLQFLTGLRQNTLGLGLQNQQRDLALAQAPISARMGLASSAAFNPFLNRDTTQYYPGLSPSGQAMMSFGNTASGVFGNMAGYGATDSLLSKYPQLASR